MSAQEDLKAFISGIGGVGTLGHADKIRMFAWLQHHLMRKDRFQTADINWCYNTLNYQPSNTSQFLKTMEGKEFLKDGRGYFCEGNFRDQCDRKFGVHEITLNIRQQIKEVMTLVPGIEEQDFMKEAEVCLRHDAGRATIIMVWCVGFYHLCQYIIKHRLVDFNSGFQTLHPNLWKDSKVKTMVKYEDFLTLKESVVIDICKRQMIVNANVAKILSEKLDKRNSAAHPSTVRIGQLQAENFVDELIKNVILALNT
jgi:hypothetical protein